MKKLKKLHLKKVTLRDLDEPTMQGIAGGAHTSAHTCPATCASTCPATCAGQTCSNCGCKPGVRLPLVVHTCRANYWSKMNRIAFVMLRLASVTYGSLTGHHGDIALAIEPVPDSRRSGTDGAKRPNCPKKLKSIWTELH